MRLGISCGIPWITRIILEVGSGEIDIGFLLCGCRRQLLLGHLIVVKDSFVIVPHVTCNMFDVDLFSIEQAISHVSNPLPECWGSCPDHSILVV